MDTYLDRGGLWILYVSFSYKPRLTFLHVTTFQSPA